MSPDYINKLFLDKWTNEGRYSLIIQCILTVIMGPMDQWDGQIGPWRPQKNSKWSANNGNYLIRHSCHPCYMRYTCYLNKNNSCHYLAHFRKHSAMKLLKLFAWDLQIYVRIYIVNSFSIPNRIRILIYPDNAVMSS